ncbi:MAG: LysE family transporter [Culturomica sp.]|jgi:threonine/homoserine/homoserine lactone efflux protein|nr:LysE family transporter [Culturomica sp.]
MYDLVYILKGILIGLMVSIPLGPMGVLIIQKTLHKGALSGFIAGMGAACADLFYAIIATFGIGFVMNMVQTHELLLQVIGGILLLVLGLTIYFGNPLKQIKSRRKVSKKGLLGDFLTLFFLTVSNPVTVVVFMAIFAGTAVFGNTHSVFPEIMVIIGILIGGAAWWYLVSTVVNIFRKKFKLRLLMMINRIAGIVIAVLGIVVILAVFTPLKQVIPT